MTKAELLRLAESEFPLALGIAQTIWKNPEVAGEETRSSSFLREILMREGFGVVNCAELPNAFYAEFGGGSPVIALLAEFDALPGLSQQPCTERRPAEKDAPGHGCGHNLIGAAAVGAAVALKKYISAENIPGTIRLYGCPEEEKLCGKVKMIHCGMFEGCDIALSWHPGDASMVYDRAYLANASVRYAFHGRSAHAGASPHLGRSALDAVELMSVGSNYLREHVSDGVRIHYSTDGGGFPPNIVPDRAGAWYYARAPRMAEVKDILRRLELVARGAAMMTETNVDISLEGGCCEMRRNTAFADLTYSNMRALTPLQYTREELEFAQALQKTIEPAQVEEAMQKYSIEKRTALHKDVLQRNAWEKAPLTCSSDSGDISQIMPMNLFTTACWPLGCAAHTWQAASGSACAAGANGLLLAMKTLAVVGCDVLSQPKLLAEIRREFEAYQDKRPSYQPFIAS